MPGTRSRSDRDTQLLAGDHVRLQGGDQVMLLRGRDPEGDWVCEWIDAARRPHIEVFPAVRLERVE